MGIYNNTSENMCKIDHKGKQRQENYRRADAFLTWKFGPMRHAVDQCLRGSGMDWPSLFVEFIEVVEKELLDRMREYDNVWMENLKLKMETGFTPIQLIPMELLDKENKAKDKEESNGTEPTPNV